MDCGKLVLKIVLAGWGELLATLLRILQNELG